MADLIARLEGAIVHEVKKLQTPWLGKQDAASYMGFESVVSIDQLVKSGIIKAYYPGGQGHPKFKREELNDCMEAGKRGGR